MAKKDINTDLPRGRRGTGTPSNATEVVDMWEAGITDISEIAAQTGNTRGQVAVFLRQAGHEVYAGHTTLLDRYTDAEIEEMLDDYYEKEMRMHELCHKWDLAENASFYNIIRRLGKKPRTRAGIGKDAGRKAALDHAVDLYDTRLDMTIHQIWAETGVDPSSLNAEVHKRGITLRRDRDGGVLIPVK